jgi:hypothetical protein
VGARLDAVLPLTLADAPRAQLLFRTLDRFFEPPGTCWVVVPDAELAKVRRELPRGPYVPVAETALVPELRRHQAAGRLKARLRLGLPAHGWHVQQLVKLAAADLVESRAYLTLDADVLCVRPTRYEDLVREGRAVAQITPPHHPEWNDAAAEILGLPRSGRQHGVTPAVLAREGVRALARHLERRSGEPWRRHLLRRLPWTEYSLYGTFLEGAGRWDELHVDGGEEALYGNSVWIHGQWPDWEPAAFFGRPDAPPFAVVQSATWIPPEQVWGRVAPFVERSAIPSRAASPA